ncbi:MAG: hypothetical protein ABI883_05710 [Chthoniobacterales bacterium]
MAQKKETGKKDIKMQDLAPKKDAKGGAARKTMDGSSGLNKGTQSLDKGTVGLN